MTLHILDDRDPQACGTTLALLAKTLRQSKEPSRVLILGGSALEHRARAQGIDPIQRVGIPFGRALLAPTAVHHAMNHGPTQPPAHRRANENTDEEIHAWSVTALAAAAVFRPGTPRTYHLTQRPCPRTARRLYKLMLRAGFNARALSDDIRRRLLDAGLPPGRVYVEPDDIHETVSQPGRSEPAPADPGHFGDRDTTTVALISEPAPAASVNDAATAAAMTRRLLCPGLRLVVAPNQRDRPQRQAVLDEIENADLLIQTPELDTPWTVLPRVDAALLSPQAGPLSVDLAKRSACAVIAPNLPHFREQLDGRANVFWAADPRARSLAHALTVWLRDATEQTHAAPRAAVTA